jgi:hypothetical protein
MPAIGAAELDFGAFPGTNEASVTFADTNVITTSKVEAFFMAGDTTTDHTAADHRYAGLFIALTALPTNGVGGTIYGRSADKMTGKFAVRWIWAD